jgi:hypothetical protein
VLRDFFYNLVEEVLAMDKTVARCTGPDAVWCPVCGECCCEVGMLPDFIVNCELHGPKSVHGEREIIETAWGYVEVNPPCQECG